MGSVLTSGVLGSCGCVDYHVADCPYVAPPAFGTMGIHDDPDAFDRLRDEGYFDDYRYSGKEPWQ